MPWDCTNETCTSGAGTLVLEFAVLSRLLGDPVYEAVARRAVKRLWAYRSNVTGLFGRVPVCLSSPHNLISYAKDVSCLPLCVLLCNLFVNSLNCYMQVMSSTYRRGSGLGS